MDECEAGDEFRNAEQRRPNSRQGDEHEQVIRNEPEDAHFSRRDPPPSRLTSTALTPIPFEKSAAYPFETLENTA